ncbi:17043_t:CDS:1, partial [Rhizophagus irregularis]
FRCLPFNAAKISSTPPGYPLETLETLLKCVCKRSKTLSPVSVSDVTLM